MWVCVAKWIIGDKQTISRAYYEYLSKSSMQLYAMLFSATFCGRLFLFLGKCWVFGEFALELASCKRLFFLLVFGVDNIYLYKLLSDLNVLQIMKQIHSCYALVCINLPYQKVNWILEHLYFPLFLCLFHVSWCCCVIFFFFTSDT